MRIFYFQTTQIINIFINNTKKLKNKYYIIKNINNQLTNLPNEIGQLINLQDFNCSYNQLTNLPNEIGQLINLKTILCFNNQLTDLPNEIGQLINLQKLDCSNNQLTNLPDEIKYLNKLIIFKTDNNNFKNLNFSDELKEYLKNKKFTSKNVNFNY